MKDTEFHDGQEFYAGTWQPVWPSRHHEIPDMRTGKPKGPLREDDLVLTLLDKLDKLEQRTRPGKGPPSAEGKDFAAFEALEAAAHLAYWVAGWAIDHQRGLALAGLKFLPLYHPQTRSIPEYTERKRAVDSHDHERAGGLLTQMTGEQERAFLRNLLRPMWRLGLPPSIIQALEALEFGETLDVLKPKKRGLTVKYLERRLQLTAIKFVEYEKAKGVPKIRSWEKVAECYGVDANTAREWQSEVRRELGELEVANAIHTAQTSAKTHLHWQKQRYTNERNPEDESNQNYFEEMYGLPALINASKAWKSRRQL